MAFTSQVLGAVLQVDGRMTEGGVIEIVPGARLLLDVGVENVEPGALLDEIATAVSEAQAARDEAVDISGISTSDEVIASRIETPGTATQTALSATIAAAVPLSFTPYASVAAAEVAYGAGAFEEGAIVLIDVDA